MNYSYWAPFKNGVLEYTLIAASEAEAWDNVILFAGRESNRYSLILKTIRALGNEGWQVREVSIREAPGIANEDRG